MLLDQPKGTYLLRNSQTPSVAFALSFVGENGASEHFAIYRSTHGMFFLYTDEAPFSSLKECLDSCSLLLKPLSGGEKFDVPVHTITNQMQSTSLSSRYAKPSLGKGINNKMPQTVASLNQLSNQVCNWHVIVM